MARVTGPLLSLGASGTVAKTQTYGKWRGIATVRRHVIPANPKSTGQVLTRNIFKALNVRWKQGGPLMRAPWDRFAAGQQFLGVNQYVGKNINLQRTDVNMADYIGSPGAKGGLAPLTLVLTTVAAGGIEAVVTAPAPPTGWTLTSAIATMLKDQLPEAVVGDVVQEGEDTSSPYSIDITGLATVLYYVQAWLKWAKPDGSVAYGASITDSITVT